MTSRRLGAHLGSAYSWQSAPRARNLQNTLLTTETGSWPYSSRSVFNLKWWTCLLGRAGSRSTKSGQSHVLL